MLGHIVEECWCQGQPIDKENNGIINKEDGMCGIIIIMILGKNNDMGGGGQLNNNGIAKFIVAVWLYTDS